MTEQEYNNLCALAEWITRKGWGYSYTQKKWINNLNQKEVQTTSELIAIFISEKPTG